MGGRGRLHGTGFLLTVPGVYRIPATPPVAAARTTVPGMELRGFVCPPPNPLPKREGEPVRYRCRAGRDYGIASGCLRRIVNVLMTPASTPCGVLVCGRPVYRGLGERPTARPGNGGFRDSHHEDTKARRNTKEELLSFPRLLVSLSPCLLVSLSGFPVRLKARYLHDEGTRYLHDDWCDRYLHDSRAGSTGVTRHAGLTGVFPESSALIGLCWAAFAQVLRANRESTPLVFASAAGTA